MTTETLQHTDRKAQTSRVRLSGLRCIAYEIALNGWQILRKTVNDFSLWRLIEYPWATEALEARRGDLVVDIGSGTSSYPHMLAKEGLDIIVVELEPERVRWQLRKRQETARPGDGRLIPLVGDATKLPLRDGSVKLISAVSSLEHIPDDTAVGREIARVLEPGGRAVLTLPFTSGERTEFFKGVRTFKQVDRNAFVQQGKSGSFFRFYTLHDIRRVYLEPARASIRRWRGFGRSLLNGRYHETKLTRYWRSYILKDWLLAAIVHPLEERFDSSDPLYVMFAFVKGRGEKEEVGSKK